MKGPVYNRVLTLFKKGIHKLSANELFELSYLAGTLEDRDLDEIRERLGETIDFKRVFH